MVTSIALGSVSEQNGRSVVTGGSSGGLDTTALLEALTEARRLPATQLEDRIGENTELSAAYSTLQTTLTTFRSATDLLRNPPGVQNADENIFEYRTASIGGNTSGAASNYISVTAQPGASLSDYSVTIDQLATFNTRVTNTFSLADADTDAVGAGLPFSAGTLILGATQSSITIDADDTLNQVVGKINAVKDTTKVEASILQVSDGQFRLSLKTTETGTQYNYSLDRATPPSFVTSEAVLRVDAQDIDGDGDYADNPVADQAVSAPVDATGTTTLATNGVNPQLDVDASSNGSAQIDFSAGTGSYDLANAVDINTGGPYSEKTLAVSFTTGSDISGDQVIYEQGANLIGYSLHISEDASNGNAPTMYAVIYDSNWDSGQERQVLNLGAVTADTDYNVVIELDASANSGANDAGNTFTGFINGQQVDQQTGVRELTGHGEAGIGGANANVQLADGTFSNGGVKFKGQISEVVQFNRTLTGDEQTELNDYFSEKYSEPIGDSSVFNVGFAIEQRAQDAYVSIDGTVITRGNNSFGDVIDGLAFSLLSETGAGETLSVGIEPDTELVQNAILNFVDSYNALRVLIAEQTEIGDDGTPEETALLSNSSTLRTISTRVNTEITAIVEGITNGNFDRLADIGLSFEDFEGDAETPFTRNVLVVDEASLSSAISANFDQVRDLFEFDFSTTDPNVTIFSRTNELDTTSITLDVDQTNGIYQATYDNGSGPVTVNLDATTLSGGGVVLDGQAGTVLAGLQLIYADSGDASGILVNFSQGLGDRVFNTIDAILDEDNGLLVTELESIADTNTRYQEEIDRIDEIVERYREQLILQFSALETAISQADLILQSLNAQSEARLSAS